MPYIRYYKPKSIRFSAKRLPWGLTDNNIVHFLEAPEPAQMEKKADGNYFTLGHCRWAFGSPAQDKGLRSFVKIFAELIHKTENIANFKVVNHK